MSCPSAFVDAADDLLELLRLAADFDELLLDELLVVDTIITGTELRLLAAGADEALLDVLVNPGIIFGALLDELDVAVNDGRGAKVPVVAAAAP